MNPEVLAEWFRLQEYTVLRTESSYWVNFGPRTYQAFPYHWQINPSEAELRAFMRTSGAISLRYSTSLQNFPGRLSYHVVYEGEAYKLASLPKKARHDVRKGLDYATYQRISFKQLATDGWTIRKNTLIRQGRENSETQDWWEVLCYSAEDLPGFEAWGMLHDDKLVASLLAFSCEDTYSILYQQSLADHLPQGINNALTYVVSQGAIERQDIKRIFYGLQSLDAPDSVDNFKFRMRYSAKPVRQRVLFNTWLTPLFNSISYRIIKTTKNWKPKNLALAKAEGMMRFYLEGKLPLEDQPVPVVLADRNGI